MARAFAEIAFTNSVKAAQTRYGSRDSYRRFELGEKQQDTLSENETAFLAERDSFYMASVGENGWPYVQHRGGPKGFLKVLDESTIGFADFEGNHQYISIGNLNTDNRVALFIMDYPNRQRLKIWARARVVHRDEDAKLLASLSMPDYRAQFDRGIILTIEAFDRNCPQHITPRFSEEEVRQIIAPLMEENHELKAKLAQIKG